MMEKKNITQLELSRKTGIATSNISDWKKKKTNPKADCLLSICDALEITPDQLLTGKGIDPEYKDSELDAKQKYSCLAVTPTKWIEQTNAIGIVSKICYMDFSGISIVYYERLPQVKTR